jgi:sucrose-6-phosphate hydrolase SacC (GH32 family)
VVGENRNFEGNLKIDKPYLNVPVKSGSSKAKFSLFLDGVWQTCFEVELDTCLDYDFIAFRSVDEYRNKILRIRVEGDGLNVDPIEQVSLSDQPEGIENLYSEQHRPQIHFTTRRGWINDPNGLLFYDGTYHLFYQHNPFGTSWGNMHWGHAVSRDLVHWEDRDDVLFPDSLGTIYSGSGAVDWDDTSGLRDGAHPPICLFYTAAGSHVDPGVPFSQCLARSTDGGRSWRKYDENPIVPNIVGQNRDPKVFWHGPIEAWIMALYLESMGEEQLYGLLKSADLKQWEKFDEVRMPGSGECPDLFELEIDGELETKWVFWGADGHYLLGDLDDSGFETDSGPHRFYNNGAEKRGNAYAAQTFDNIPDGDGRRIQMAWMQGDFESMPFNQQMSFPIELSLRTTANGVRLCGKPVREISKLHGRRYKIEDINLTGDLDLMRDVGGVESLHIAGTLKIGRNSVISLAGRNFEVTFDCGRGEIRCMGTSAPLPFDVLLDIEVIVDRASIEIFAANGLVYMPLYLPPCNDPPSLILSSLEGETEIQVIGIWELESCWR